MLDHLGLGGCMLRKTKLAAQLKFRVRSPKMLSQQILESTGIRLRSRKTKHVRRDIKSLAFLDIQYIQQRYALQAAQGKQGQVLYQAVSAKNSTESFCFVGVRPCAERKRVHAKGHKSESNWRKEGSWISALATLECLTMWARQRTAAATKQVLPWLGRQSDFVWGGSSTDLAGKAGNSTSSAPKSSNRLFDNNPPPFVSSLGLTVFRLGLVSSKCLRAEFETPPVPEEERETWGTGCSNKVVWISLMTNTISGGALGAAMTSLDPWTDTRYGLEVVGGQGFDQSFGIDTLGNIIDTVFAVAFWDIYKTRLQNWHDFTLMTLINPDTPTVRCSNNWPTTLEIGKVETQTLTDAYWIAV